MTDRVRERKREERQRKKAGAFSGGEKRAKDAKEKDVLVENKKNKKKEMKRNERPKRKSDTECKRSESVT